MKAARGSGGAQECQHPEGLPPGRWQGSAQGPICIPEPRAGHAIILSLLPWDAEMNQMCQE